MYCIKRLLSRHIFSSCFFFSFISRVIKLEINYFTEINCNSTITFPPIKTNFSNTNSHVFKVGKEGRESAKRLLHNFALSILWYVNDWPYRKPQLNEDHHIKSVVCVYRINKSSSALQDLNTAKWNLKWTNFFEYL